VHCEADDAVACLKTNNPRGYKQKTPAMTGVLICKRKRNYMAATKSGTTKAAFSCSNWIMRAAMPVYI